MELLSLPVEKIMRLRCAMSMSNVCEFRKERKNVEALDFKKYTHY